VRDDVSGRPAWRGRSVAAGLTPWGESFLVLMNAVDKPSPRPVREGREPFSCRPRTCSSINRRAAPVVTCLDGAGSHQVGEDVLSIVIKEKATSTTLLPAWNVPQAHYDVHPATTCGPAVSVSQFQARGTFERGQVIIKPGTNNQQPLHTPSSRARS